MKIKILLLYILVSFTAASQGVDNLWLIGYYGNSYPPQPCCGGGMNLDFTGGNLSISLDTNRKMSFDETNGEICDKQGNLLFSSNGVWIANNANDTMENGSGLNPSAFTTEWEDDGDGLTIAQANLIIPFPADSNKYYLFHQTVDDYPGTFCSFYLYYSIIDMTGDSGRGSVTEKNVVLVHDSLISGGLTACKHANGRDWWIINHHFNTNLYYKYLITPAGIQGPDTQYVGTERGIGWVQSCFSPDGKYFVNYDTEYSLDVFDFDRCTGNFSFITHVYINDTIGAGGVAFSPNSQVLYVSTGYNVFQYDMNDSNIAASQTAVLSLDTMDSTATGYYLAQLAPDGKIYIVSASDNNTMHRINNPDILGSDCNACHDCVILPFLNAWTIANHPNYFLGAETGSICDSLEAVENLTIKNPQLNIYPNPVVDNEVTFTYSVSSEQGIIDIYNPEGQEITHYSLPQWSSVQHLKLPKIASGIYLAQLIQGSIINDCKFIKE